MAWHWKTSCNVENPAEYFLLTKNNFEFVSVCRWKKILGRVKLRCPSHPAEMLVHWQVNCSSLPLALILYLARCLTLFFFRN